MRSMGLFVIFRQNTDELLHDMRDGEGVHLTGWCKHPKEALTFGSRAEATKVAQRLVDRKGCKLTVCELAESDRQIGLVDPCEVWPVETPPIN